MTKTIESETTTGAATGTATETTTGTTTGTATKAPKSAEEREREFLEQREAEILKKYKNVTPGSLRRETDGHHAGKLTVEITCGRKRRKDDGTEYVCGNKRRVATSDLFQVKYCEECIAEMRLAKRRRKAKQARAEKKKIEGGDQPKTAGSTKTGTKPVKPEKAPKPEKPAKPEKAPKAPKPEKAPKKSLKTPKKKMRSIEEVAAEDKAQHQTDTLETQGGPSETQGVITDVPTQGEVQAIATDQDATVSSAS